MAKTACPICTGTQEIVATASSLLYLTDEYLREAIDDDEKAERMVSVFSEALRHSTTTVTIRATDEMVDVWQEFWDGLP